jgi:hypothetical protein
VSIAILAGRTRASPIESPAGTSVFAAGTTISASPNPGSAGSGSFIAFTGGGGITVNGTAVGSATTAIALFYATNHSCYWINHTNVWTGPITTSSIGSAITGVPAGAGGQFPPSQAILAGFTRRVFNDDFTNASTIFGALTSSVQSGVNWYANASAQPSPTYYSVLTTQTAAGLSNNNPDGGLNASPNGGLWEILGTTAITDNGNFQTLPTNNSGPNLWKHAYFEAYFQFNSTLTGTAPGGPAFWSWSVASGTIVEIDFMECSTPGNTNYPATTIHIPGGGTVLSPPGQVKIQANGDSKWHTMGCLWTGNGTTGSLSFYWDNGLNSGPYVTGTGNEVPSLEAITGQFLVFGTGPGVPLYIDWVNVWQA